MAGKKDYSIGTVLILIGGLFLLSNFTETSIKNGFIILLGVFLLIGYHSKRNIGYLIGGLVILVIGVSKIVDTYNLVPIDISGFVFLLTLGFAFLSLYFLKKIRGLIYPGCILIAIGLFTFLEDSYGYDIPWAFMLLIGVSFYLIYIIETRRLGQRWPLIPGTILIVISGIMYLIMEDVITITVWETLSYIWPILLILAGLRIVYNSITKK